MMHRIQPQGITNGDGMSHTALWFIGCHHDDLPEFPHRLYQVANARRADAIVIGHQDHGLTFAAFALDTGWGSGFGSRSFRDAIRRPFRASSIRAGSALRSSNR